MPCRCWWLSLDCRVLSLLFFDFSSVCQDECADAWKLIHISTKSTDKILAQKGVTFDTELMLVSVLPWHCAVWPVGVLSCAWLVALYLLVKKCSKGDYHWQSEDVSPKLAWNIFLNLYQYFSAYSFILALSTIFKHDLNMALWLILSGEHIHIVGRNAKETLQTGAAACYSECVDKKGFSGSCKLNSICLMNIPGYSVQKLPLQPLRDCLYLNGADLC